MNSIFLHKGVEMKTGITNEKSTKTLNTALSNPFSTGGGGSYFEHQVQATFILALLTKGLAPLSDLSITAIDFQTKRLGWKTDDFMLTSSSDGYSSKLLCQIKHGVTVGENSTFEKIITDAWSDYNNPDFNKEIDQIVLISDQIPSAKNLDFIYRQAKGAANETDFLKRIFETNYSNEANKKKTTTIRTLLEKAAGRQITDPELWGFCKVFSVLVFDLDFESSVNRFLMHSLIASNCKENALNILGRLNDYAANCDKIAAHITIDSIPNTIRGLFQKKEPALSFLTMPTNQTYDLFETKLALVGSWNENNPNDCLFLEKILEESYSSIQKKLQTALLQPQSHFSLKEGIWEIDDRISIIKTGAIALFDNNINALFELAKTIFQETDQRIQDDGQFSLLIPQGGPFKHSEVLRKGLSHGLAMLGNLQDTSTSCSSGKIENEAKKFINAILSNAEVKTWQSLNGCLPILSEVHPVEFLTDLEKQIVNTPEVIQQLFPRSNGNVLLEQNFICSLLWALEGLAWDEKYFIKSIRILGLLAGMKTQKTNYSNTPINSIINIMLPWHIQTLAPLTKFKSALNVLKEENPHVAWETIKGLMPNATTMTTGTYKPHYIVHIDSDESVQLSSQERDEWFAFCSQTAIDVSKKDDEKLADLLSDLRIMNGETFNEYLKVVSTKCEKWDDSKKYAFWKAFVFEKNFLLNDEEIEPTEDIIKQIDLVLEKATPNDIRVKYQLLFEHEYLHSSKEKTFEERCEQLDKEQKAAVYDIFQQFGIEEVISFGERIKNFGVGFILGTQLNAEEFDKLLKKCYENDLDKGFFGQIIKGYLTKNAPESLLQLNLCQYPKDYIAWVLTCSYPKEEIFNLVSKILGKDAGIYWKKVEINPYHIKDLNFEFVWQQLIGQRRFVSATNLFLQKREKCDISSEALNDMLIQAAKEKSNESLDWDAIQNAIQLLQTRKDLDVSVLADTEWIYLDILNEHSHCKPLFLRYRLANDPQYFCKMIELFYKKSHDEKAPKKLPNQIGKRLFDILFNFDIIPGTDWDGLYNESVFSSWLEYCQKWGKEEDREVVLLETVGCGLSYAKPKQDGLMDDFLMKELNKPENDAMRNGYYVGILNQRGAHWVDPTGAPEKKLSEKYKNLAEKVESLGYAKFAELLQTISDRYKDMADSIVKNHQ